MPVGERDNHPVGGKIVQPLQRIGGETGFGLFAVGNHRRSGALEAFQGVAQCRVVTGIQPFARQPARAEFAQRIQ
ncbi:hypothetical protein [Methylomonas sp. LWB]|uniref:hypothetical protein n=1 Tax=Methylomonas sp. LWB TaxID=1905845 RepID=UPI0020C90457|nr:hypothetical protein [Methylomonas sp. LWB]